MSLLVRLQLQHCCLYLLILSIVKTWTCVGGGIAASAAAFITPRHQHRSSPMQVLQDPSLSSQVVANSPELGGDVIRIRTGPDEDDDDVGFLTTVGVPTFAVLTSHSDNDDATAKEILSNKNKPKRLGLEGILQNSNAFVIENAVPPAACEAILNLCEYELQFGEYNIGKNNHGAMQIVISKEVSDALLRIIGPHVDLEGIVESEMELRGGADGGEDGAKSYALTGINRRFRVYRYAPDRSERFAPHIDAGFPPGGVSWDDSVEHEGSPFLHWDASHQYPSTTDVVSRLTVLIYLNEDFSGGHTKFYEPFSESDDVNANGDEDTTVIASVKPRAGSILVFPQAISEPAVERARFLWPQHEGSPVTSGSRPKYVIRTDVLFETVGKEEYKSPEEEILFKHDEEVRNVFKNTSPLFSPLFLHHVEPLYNPYMGVENAGPLLYSLVRFTKCRNIVEVGAGYTTLYLLQALKDNDDEMERVVDLHNEGRLRLLDYPFGTPMLEDWASSPSNPSSSSLLCIDNCEHQRETASGAVHVARTLGLDSYLQFLKGDAFDALDTHFSDVESIDMLWCDFGVGNRMKDYAANVWKYIRPGGYLVCHSTLTNTRTREWLEAVRQGKGVDETGIPADEYAELSLLEPHKRFQNSMTILQKRVGIDGARFSEPIYSEYA